MAGELTAAAVMAAVETHMGGPLVYGSTDCFAGPCAAFAALHGVDPLAHLRGSYSGHLSASRIIWRHGGARRLADEIMTQAGLCVTGDVTGAIGVFRNGAEWSLAIGIEPGCWAAKLDSGFGFIAECRQAWSL